MYQNVCRLGVDLFEIESVLDFQFFELFFQIDELCFKAEAEILKLLHGLLLIGNPHLQFLVLSLNLVFFLQQNFLHLQIPLFNSLKLYVSLRLVLDLVLLHFLNSFL